MAVTGVSNFLIAAANGGNNASDSTASADTTEVLGQDAFLKLLITQLKNQNPLSPMEDTDFIAQMAQFSALEQMTQVKEQIEAMRVDVTAINLLGKTVKAQMDEDTVLEGVVESVKFSGSMPTLMVSGKEVSLGNIIEVLPTKS